MTAATVNRVAMQRPVNIGALDLRGRILVGVAAVLELAVITIVVDTIVTDTTKDWPPHRKRGVALGRTKRTP